MTEELKKNLDCVKKTLEEAEKYVHATRVINFDLETICPSKGMEKQGEVVAFLSNKAFALQKDESFIESAKFVYEHRAEHSIKFGQKRGREITDSKRTSQAICSLSLQKSTTKAISIG